MSPNAKGLASLVGQWEDMNHLYVVENFLRRLLPEEAHGQCSLSLTLTDEGELSAAVAAMDSGDSGICHRAASSLVNVINKPTQAMLDSVLGPVVSKAEVVNTPAEVGKSIGSLNPLNGLQNSLQSSVNDLNNKMTNTAADAYNTAVDNMDQGADNLENNLRSAGFALSSSLAMLVLPGLVLVMTG